MIFDSARVTALVLIWKQTRDQDVLTQILDESRPLVESIISSYGVEREDLIQEAIAKLIFSLPYFNPNVGNLHTFFTTVIRNVAATVYKKEVRHDCIDLDIVIKGENDYIQSDNSILDELLIRNRERFPSVPVNVIDSATEFIYYAMRDNYKGGVKAILSYLVDTFCLDRSIATVIYNSSIIYLRSTHLSLAKANDPDEFSILTDIKLLVGDEVYNKISIALTGMHCKFS